MVAPFMEAPMSTHSHTLRILQPVIKHGGNRLPMGNINQPNIGFFGLQLAMFDDTRGTVTYTLYTASKKTVFLTDRTRRSKKHTHTYIYVYIS